MAADCERASAAFVAVVEVLRDDAQMLDARAGHLQHFDPQTIDLDHVAGLWHPVQGLHDQTANGVGTPGKSVGRRRAMVFNKVSISKRGSRMISAAMRDRKSVV